MSCSRTGPRGLRRAAASVVVGLVCFADARPGHADAPPLRDSTTPGAAARLPPEPGATGGANASFEAVRVIPHQCDDHTLAYRRTLPEARPPLPGFRAPVLAAAAERPPFDVPAGSETDPIVRAATHVAQHLARDGLLPTAAHAAELLALDPTLSRDEWRDRLSAVGLPVDWLVHFHPPRSPQADLLDFLRSARQDGRTAAELSRELSQASFRFRPTRPGFELTAESGEHEAALLRLQLTRGDYWAGKGDGGSVDIARQLVEQLPAVPLLVSIEQRFVEAFLVTARDWPLAAHAGLTAVTEPFPVAQWAQDNAKPGLVAAPDGSRRAALIVPRYASRGEDGSTFVPGESFLVDGLAAAGLELIHSPLLFQGGNLMPVVHQPAGRRLLLVGEAEIWRNVALGLSRAQVEEALRVEFGAERCIVLPAVSYHIDYEVCVRNVHGRTVAFVNDSPPAVAVILARGADALASSGVLDAAAAAQARRHASARHWREYVGLVAPHLMARTNTQGRFPERLTRAFSTGPADSHVGNFQRFLLAMDLATAAAMSPSELPRDPAARAYVSAIRRRDDDRRRLWTQLATLGWTIVPIPSLAEADRGINYINGVHTSSAYLMPAYGGWYAELDRTAHEAFEKAIGPVKVIPVLCGESQRRNGALRCALSALPGWTRDPR